MLISFQSFHNHDEFNIDRADVGFKEKNRRSKTKAAARVNDNRRDDYYEDEDMDIAAQDAILSQTSHLKNSSSSIQKQWRQSDNIFFVPG